MATVSIDRFRCLLLTEDCKVLKEKTAHEGLPDEERFVSVHSACRRGAALGDDGYVWVWGIHAMCCLGSNIWFRETTEHPPMRVPRAQFGGSSVQTIALGDNNACMIADKRLYTCGYSVDGRLGYRPVSDSTKGNIHKLQHVQILDEHSADVPVVDVVVGKESCGAVGCDGSVWTWGPNNMGECGLGDSERPHRVPTRVATIGAAPGVAFTAKRIFMHSHTVVVAFDGSVNVWGANGFGQLGLGGDSKETRVLPVCLPCVPVRSAACGWRHTLLLTTEGVVLACGHNRYGALGLCARPETAGLPNVVAGIEATTDAAFARDAEFFNRGRRRIAPPCHSGLTP